MLYMACAKLFCILIALIAVSPMSVTTQGTSDATSTITSMGLSTDDAVTTTPGQSSTLRPLVERECFPGFACLHGVCDKATFTCKCDPGWHSGFCELPDITTVVETTTSETTITPEAHSVGTTAPELPLITVKDWEPLENFGPLPPLSDRTCPGVGSFVCRYGNCSLEQGLSCQCDPSFRDTFCDKPCTLECGEKARCEFWHSANGSEHERCYCFDHQYYGTNCSYVEPWEQSSDTLSAGAVAALVVVGVLVACLVALMLVAYCLWRRRNIAMMRIVYRFKSFEDDDDKAYDAFVSYASSDRTFIMQVLVPCLEREGFSLCLHERDLLAGQYISENISDGVQQSRRTIMLVSRDYVGSEWCQFEFQMALHEMISHKHRIVPILIDDIRKLREDMDGTLKKVLDVVTLIKYPGEHSDEKTQSKFWKRIHLSMPKKREVTNSDIYTNRTSKLSEICRLSSHNAPPPASLPYNNSKKTVTSGSDKVELQPVG